jgi:capsular exopolysaccharide synthesis family protein
MKFVNGGKGTLKQREINLYEYWRIVNKRRWMIAAFALVVLAGAAFKTFTMTPTYTAKGTLIIEKEPNILTFQEIFQIESYRDDYYQTQYKLLQSYALAERTVEKLGLAEKKARELNARPMKKNGQPVDPKNPGFKRGLAESLMGAIKVRPIRLTRLVDIEYSDKDPNAAADTVNALFDAFVDMSIETKYAATEQASEFLTNQIKSITKEIESAQQQLQRYGAEKNIVALSDKETTTIEKLAALNSALTEATIERVKKETYYNEVKIASPDYIPETMGNQLIQRLRETYVGLSRDYQKKAETYKPDYPEMVRLKSELDTTRGALETETQSFIKGTYSDFQAALKKEQSLTDVFNTQKQEALLLNSNAIAYNSLKNEIDNKKNLLESLMTRQSETDVSARLRGLRTSNVRVVDTARVPVAPSSPNIKRNLLLALFLGLFGGIGLAFLMEYLDNSVKTSEDIERYAKLPTLGIIPEFNVNEFKKGYGYGYGYGSRSKKKEKRRELESDGKIKVWREASPAGEPAGASAKAAKEGKIKAIELITYYAPKSDFSENYRSIRTAFLLSSAGPSRKAMIIASALPEEGKSAYCCNFAVTLAQNNKKTLILDADLRKPRQHRIFDIKNVQGLTNYLSGGLELESLIKGTKVPNLFLVNAGPIPPNPMELLGSEKMGHLLERLKEVFDYVVIDTPPLLSVSDAFVLAPHADGVILVVWSGKTRRESLRLAKEKLDLMSVSTLGVVINRINLKELGYYYRDYYHRYGDRESA